MARKEDSPLENIVESIGVKSRIPPFWRDNPRLWFAHFETMVAAQKLGDENKFGLAVSQLEKCDVEQIGDILIGPQTGRYESLKARLLSVYEVSEGKKLQKLLNEMELGDQRPSQLLRRMQDLARDNMAENTLRLLWMGHLPASTRAVLSISEETLKLEALAAMADKMHEQAKEVNIVCSCKGQPAKSEKSDVSIVEAIEDLRKEIAQLKMDRSRSRERRRYSPAGRRFRSRSRSQAQRNSNQNQATFIHEDLSKCSHLFVRNDAVKRPLTPNYDGPFEVMDRHDKYYTLEIKGRTANVSIDRLKPAFFVNMASENITNAYVTRSGRISKPPVRFAGGE